jgi:hypothetical protein
MYSRDLVLLLLSSLKLYDYGPEIVEDGNYIKCDMGWWVFMETDMQVEVNAITYR